VVEDRVGEAFELRDTRALRRALAGELDDVATMERRLLGGEPARSECAASYFTDDGLRVAQ
jgi:hypothetical protein